MIAKHLLLYFPKKLTDILRDSTWFLNSIYLHIYSRVYRIVILNLRDKLNQSIISGEDYSVIYQLSIELDELIAKYYLESTPEGIKQ